jgi:tetratricopeptide (TPR) repeat protein
MSRLSRKKHQSSRNASAQSGAQAHLDAVMRRVEALLLADQVNQAIQVLESNRARLSQFAPFRAALATLYDQVGRNYEAAVEARTAVDLDPRHADYYLLAAVSYFAAGYYSFAQRARQQWLRSAPYGPLLGEMRRLDEEYRAGSEQLRDEYNLRDTRVAEEAGYRLDEGRWALAQNRWDEALKHSQAAAELISGWPPPRNNASAALFYLGRYAEAVSTSEAVLRDCDPDNLHAMANLVRYHVILRQDAVADEYAGRLSRLPLPEGLEGLVKQIEGLAFRDRDADIDRILAAAKKHFGDLPPETYVHWGIAAANAGRRREALSHLRRAQEAGEGTALLRSTLDGLERKQPGPGMADRYPQMSFVDLIAPAVVEQVGKQLMRDEKQGFRDHQAWDDLLRRYPQLPLVAGRMLYEVPDSIRPMAHLLAGLRTPEAIATLRQFVGGQKGSHEDRVQVLQIIQQAGVLPPDAEVEMWVDGERHPIQSMLQEISDEFVPDYRPEVWELYDRALTAHRKGRIAEAERLYEAMLRAEPKAKEAYNNLASIYHQRGDVARANEYMDKALAIDPLYPFPITSRVSQALGKGDVVAAKALLEPLHRVRQWHPLGFVAYQKAMARIAIEEKEYKAARQHLELAQQLVEDDPEIKELLDWLALGDLSSDVGDWWRDYDEQSCQRRVRRVLPADPSLADCLHVLSKGDMEGIAGVVELRLRHPHKRADIEGYLLDHFPDLDFLADVVGGLNEAERAALSDLLAHDGVMDREAFIQAHGDEGDDRPYLEYHGANMKSVKGRLRARGLLFEGTANDRPIVATPRELRSPLRNALARGDQDNQ